MADERYQLDRFRQELPQPAFRNWLGRVAGWCGFIAAGVPHRRENPPGEVGEGPDWQHFQAIPPAEARWIRILSSAISK
jgi:hypothetical protein